MNDGGPAFPVPLDKGWSGMSLRDYFAAAALNGFLSINAKFPGILQPTEEDYSRAAYTVADAMLKEREKKP